VKTDLQRFIKLAEALEPEPENEEDAVLLEMILREAATQQMAGSMSAKRPWAKIDTTQK
jgi:hypothetical protein